MIIDCDTCFNKKYYPPKAIEDVCKFCQEKNGRFYRTDLTDIKGYAISARRIKNDSRTDFGRDI